MDILQDYEHYDDYTTDNTSDHNSSSAASGTLFVTKSSFTNVLVAFSAIVCVVGLMGNSVVIWICGCKMRRMVNTIWYTSLAVSDFLFCACLPMEIYYVVTSHWPFGQLLCKLTSSALFLNMYSSVFLLVLISADRCVMISFPIWSQNQRTVKKASVVVMLIWTLSALLTLPSLIYRQTTIHGSVTQCHTDYGLPSTHKAVVLMRFIWGFLIPFLVIVLCCSVLSVKLRNLTLKSTKPYKIMAALILTFFICWVPYHAFVLLELDVKNHSLDVIQTGLKVGGALAAANSCINPVLYVFIGKEFTQTLRRSLVSRIENAMADDFRNSGHNPCKSRVMTTY